MSSVRKVTRALGTTSVLRIFNELGSRNGQLITLGRNYSSPPTPNSQQHQLTTNQRKKVTIHSIRRMYESGEPISMMTAQDYPSGLMVDKAGIDMCLVGDSLAMVVLGHESTNPITLDEMLHHCRAVARGCKFAFLVGDMPYGSYELSAEEAMRSAIRFIKHGNVDAVKLEGGIEMAETIYRIVRIGVPVVGHVGLKPQRCSSLGGFRVQGKTASQAKALWEDAVAVQNAGAFALVVESVPEAVGTLITRNLRIPTVGIGAGIGCSGQVLVQNDILGLFDRFTPKFSKQYANLGEMITKALHQYHVEVKSRSFPAKEHTYSIDDGEFSKFKELMIEQGLFTTTKHNRDDNKTCSRSQHIMTLNSPVQMQ